MTNEERETVPLTGTKENPVKSDDILKAINEGKNVKVQSPFIKGDLDVKYIEYIFDIELDEKTGTYMPIIPVHISILTENNAIWLGKKEEPIEVSADEVLYAIEGKKSIVIIYAVIRGNLDIRRRDNLKDENGKSVILGGIRIWSSEIKGKAYFRNATFSKYADLT